MILGQPACRGDWNDWEMEWGKESCGYLYIRPTFAEARSFVLRSHCEMKVLHVIRKLSLKRVRGWGGFSHLPPPPHTHTHTHQFVPYLRKYQRTSKLLTNSWIKMTNGKCFVALEAFPAILDNLNLNISGVACPKFPSHGSCVFDLPYQVR